MFEKLLQDQQVNSNRGESETSIMTASVNVNGNVVENKQRDSLTAEGVEFSSEHVTANEFKYEVGKKTCIAAATVSAAADLVNYHVAKCILGSDGNESCFKTRNLSFDGKERLLREECACFRCLLVGHLSKQCRVHLRCVICARSHISVMCPELPSNKQISNETDNGNCDKDYSLSSIKEHNLTNRRRADVFSQILRILLQGEEESYVVGDLVDRLYILKTTVAVLGCRHKWREKIIHCLFGGRIATVAITSRLYGKIYLPQQAIHNYNKIRLVRMQTARGQVSRPVQRKYLECLDLGRDQTRIDETRYYVGNERSASEELYDSESAGVSEQSTRSSYR